MRKITLQELKEHKEKIINELTELLNNRQVKIDFHKWYDQTGRTVFYYYSVDNIWEGESTLMVTDGKLTFLDTDIDGCTYDWNLNDLCIEELFFLQRECNDALYKEIAESVIKPVYVSINKIDGGLTDFIIEPYLTDCGDNFQEYAEWGRKQNWEAKSLINAMNLHISNIKDWTPQKEKFLTEMFGEPYDNKGTKDVWWCLEYEDYADDLNNHFYQAIDRSISMSREEVMDWFTKRWSNGDKLIYGKNDKTFYLALQLENSGDVIDVWYDITQF